MNILPIPEKSQALSGIFLLKHNCKIIMSPKCTIKENHYCKILQKSIANLLGYSVSITKGAYEEGNIFLDLAELEKESYILDIRTNHVKIVGGSTAGLLHGIQSFRQLLREYKATIPSILIEDKPSIKHRGFYHDVTRGRIPTLKTLKDLADTASYYKINELQLYMEHSFLFKNFSEVWRDDTPITAEEILEFDEYCANLNIELIPSIATFGHLHKILTTKTFKDYNELETTGNEPFSFPDRMAHHTINVTDPRSIKLIEKMLDEYIPLFSSNKFNICADETFDLGKGKNKNLANEVGSDKLYVDFVREICNITKKHNKVPMFWGDIISKNPERIKELPEDIICLTWGYSPTESDESAQKIHNTNTKQYLCPGVQGWSAFMNFYEDAFKNISFMCSYAHKYKAMGLLNTDWGDYGHMTFPESSMIGLIYGATLSWNNSKIDFEHLNKMISLTHYENRTMDIVKIISDISKNQVFTWRKAVQYLDFKHKNSNQYKEILTTLADSTNNNLIIGQNILKLYDTLKEISESKRHFIKDYIVMAEGIILFNEIGNVLLNIGNTEKDKLAIDIEYWWMDYKELWRKYSKESELFRLQEIIVEYCDYLRS
ncbi:MAG: beta-N-acetylhexosaminidase [Lachnospirales bacterium]